MQNFIGVNIANSGHHRLVEQQRLHPAISLCEPVAKSLKSEVARERVEP